MQKKQGRLQVLHVRKGHVGIRSHERLVLMNTSLLLMLIVMFLKIKLLMVPNDWGEEKRRKREQQNSTHYDTHSVWNIKGAMAEDNDSAFILFNFLLRVTFLRWCIKYLMVWKWFSGRIDNDAFRSSMISLWYLAGSARHRVYLDAIFRKVVCEYLGIRGSGNCWSFQTEDMRRSD